MKHDYKVLLIAYALYEQLGEEAPRTFPNPGNLQNDPVARTQELYARSHVADQRGAIRRNVPPRIIR